MNRPLFLVNITGFVIGISYGLHMPILPIFAKNVAGATYAELGLIGVANFLPYMIIPLLVGILLDRFNGGRLLAVGVVINSVSVYLLSIAQSVPEIIIFRVMSGFAHAFFWPPCESIISDHSKPGSRVKNLSRFIMSFVAGFMIGPLIGAWMLDGLNATHPFLFEITALAMLTTIAAALMVSRHHIKRQHRKFEISSLSNIVKFPGIVIVLLFCTASYGLMLTIYPAYLSDRGIRETDILILYFVLGVARLGALAIAGTLARRAGAVQALGTAGVAIGFGISAFAESFEVFVVALVLSGFILSVYLPLTLEALLLRTKARSAGSIIGAYETLFGIGWMIGPAISGLVTETVGDVYLYLGLCMTGIAVALVATRYRKDLEIDRNTVGA